MLDDKVVLVTGASRGIGEAIMLTLAKNGAYVIGTATSEQGVFAIQNLLTKHNVKGRGALLNVTDDEQINNLIDKSEDIDILVNNAGITADNLLMRMNIDEWDRVIQTNLTGVYKMSRAVLRPMLKKRWGRIVSIASIIGATGNAGQTNYAAAKAGIVGFTKSLAYEVSHRGITVNAIAPGFIVTDMTNNLTEKVKENIIKKIPMGKLGTPQNIADGVLFLVGNSGNYINAQTLHINGGMYTV